MTLYCARQPIFDRSCRASAYELKFSSTGEEERDAAGQEEQLEDIEDLTGGRPAFVSLTLDLPPQEIGRLLASGKTTVQVPPYLAPKPDVVDACRRLKSAGYQLAVSGLSAREEGNELLDMADIVRVDFRHAEPDRRQSLCESLHDRGVQALAASVDSYEILDQATHWGYDLFAGDFYTEPDLREAKEISGNRLVYLQMLVEISRPDISYKEVSELVRRDVSLTFKLLRFMNSAWFGFRSKIRSIQHALVLLGPAEIRKWFTVTAMRHMGTDKPEELVLRSLIRARAAELIAPEIGLGDDSDETFLVGMFSLIDALMDWPMQDVTEMLPLTDRVEAALVGQEGPFAPLLKLMQTYEAGRWEAFSEKAAALDVSEQRVATLFHGARRWADEAFSTLS